ncbi:histidine kinase [Neohortaea acidophila]|uniref:histidine kinase n=1 Tax=Neohortaea acidophila TaxID=245834 RepID=A0A6A6PML5_9PEZI|nr:histidine kinase [Neohortaea acidophila]KAF2481056.1 histidine kinase [Neohortaea acidophila]
MSAEATAVMVDRQSVCLPHYGTQDVLQHGDPRFADVLNRYYPVAESEALEAVVRLKAKLPSLSADDFFPTVTEDLSRILRAEMAFVAKRVLVDEHEAAVEMPPIGEPGACLMASALHFCSEDGSKTTLRDFRYAGHGCPCAYMRHDKVFVVPEKLGDFFTNNPNKLPFPAAAYIAVPLFAEGKCFAHFGVMWSEEGAAKRVLSWGFIEMLLHSLEDLMQQRLVQGANFLKPTPLPETSQVIPHAAVTLAQSLRPYAGSLSHELRTPMQGIVGMLDVMYATVEEAVSGHIDPRLRRVFEELKENIQVVQDSSRRAVEAADNVVHAYDMDMSVPESSGLPFLDDLDSASPFSTQISADRRPEIFVSGSNLPLSRKRRRDEASSRHNSNASSKVQKLEAAAAAWSSNPREPSQEIKDGLQEAGDVHSYAQPGATPTNEDAELAAHSLTPIYRHVAPGLRHTNIREVFRYVINEGLKMGGRPDSALAQETTYGEIVEVRSRGSDGTAKTKYIEWSVDPSLPMTIFMEEKDLSKLVSCVILNAIKFTDQHGGRVEIHARLSSRGKYVSIKVADNGPGIPAAFLPRLFMPFSRENESTTRSSEGLGLGLMVAKGIARKLGGDLMCTRAETEGEHRGSEFEIRIPTIAGETLSRPTSPFGSPLPRRPSLAPIIATPKTTFQPSPESPKSPNKLSRALQDAVDSHPAPPKSDSHSTPPKSLHPPTVTSLLHGMTSSPPSPPHDQPSTTHLEPQRPRFRKSVSNPEIDRDLANKYPLTFLVAEDNKINRKLLVSMLRKFGYDGVYEAHDGAEAVRQMKTHRDLGVGIDVVLMDLWMPLMDGYEATQRILSEVEGELGAGKGAGANGNGFRRKRPTVLAVTADVTDGAQERAARVGMKGFMTKPYKINDLQRLITEYCAQREGP